MTDELKPRGILVQILVTGATGFIGRHLCESFWNAGHTVVVLSRTPERAMRRLKGIKSAYEWEPLAGRPPAAAFNGVDAVVHLAGENVFSRWTAGKKQNIYDSRVVGTRHLVDTVEQLPKKPHVLIAASAAGYYGDRGDSLLDETSGPGVGFLSHVSTAWEREAMRAEASGLRVVRLRSGLVLGNGGGLLRVLGMLFRLSLGGTLGTGDQWWSWIHIRDHSGLIQHAIAGDISGPLNATSPHPVRQRVFAETLGRTLRRPTSLTVPSFVLRILLGEMSNEALTSKRVTSIVARETGYSFEFTDLTNALKDLF
jgi:uncharacterized protein (TIGR01777 family)